MATTTKTNSKSKTLNPKAKAVKAVVATKTPKIKLAPVEKAKVAPVANPEVIVLAGKGRMITGKVVSDKMTNTVVIEVTRLVAHPMYHKRMRRTNKFHAHNTIGAKTGNLVEITECRPVSKTKFFTVTKVINSHS